MSYGSRLSKDLGESLMLTFTSSILVYNLLRNVLSPSLNICSKLKKSLILWSSLVNRCLIVISSLPYFIVYMMILSLLLIQSILVCLPWLLMNFMVFFSLNNSLWLAARNLIHQLPLILFRPSLFKLCHRYIPHQLNLKLM